MSEGNGAVRVSGPVNVAGTAMSFETGRLAELDDDGAVGERRKAAGLEGQGLAVRRDRAGDSDGFRHGSVLLS